MRNLFRGWKLIGVAAIAAVLSVDVVALAEPAGPPLPSIVDGRSVLPSSGAGPASGMPAEFSLNPLDVLDGAVRSVGPGGVAGMAGSGGAGPEAPTGQGLSAALNVLILLTVISLAPSIMLMTTCFVRIIVVLGLLKQALGAQSIPPPQVIVALAMFMTLLVMAPTLDRINTEALQPYRAGVITDHEQLWARAREPVRDFMFTQIETTGNWSSLYMVLDYRGIDVSEPEKLTRGDVDMISLIPAFMLSELKTAFLMGFKVYLPFLVIDMVISSLLISMSMMMLPPVLISLPFKLLLFVLVDGWQLIVGSLMSSFGQPAARTASAVGQSVLPGILPAWG